jgi:hypothetical protein
MVVGRIEGACGSVSGNSVLFSELRGAVQNVRGKPSDVNSLVLGYRNNYAMHQGSGIWHAWGRPSIMAHPPAGESLVKKTLTYSRKTGGAGCRVGGKEDELWLGVLDNSRNREWWVLLPPVLKKSRGQRNAEVGKKKGPAGERRRGDFWIGRG